MASNSESGFNFPAPKPRSSSARARLDAIARGKRRALKNGGSAGLFGSISDLGDAGSLEELDPTTSRAPARTRSNLLGPARSLPELELDGIPDAFFEAVEREHPSDSGFELPSSFGDSSAPAVMGNQYPEPEQGAPQEDDLRGHLADIPSGFFRALDDDSDSDSSENRPSKAEGGERDEFSQSARFDFDFDVPSVLGEQPDASQVAVMNHREPETEPMKAAPDLAGRDDGHLTIPPVAAAIARPAADSSFQRSADDAGAMRKSARSRRSSGSHAGVGSRLHSWPQLRDAEPGVLVFPQMPVRAAFCADEVPRTLSDSATSPTRRGPQDTAKGLKNLDSGKLTQPHEVDGRGPLRIDSHEVDMEAGNGAPFGSAGAKGPVETTLRRPRMVVTSSAYATTSVPEPQTGVEPRKEPSIPAAAAAAQIQRIEPLGDPRAARSPATDGSPAEAKVEASLGVETPSEPAAKTEPGGEPEVSAKPEAPAPGTPPAKPARKRFRRIGPSGARA